ncbi:MAG: hypothetical protein LBD67_01425 [Candidatus Accumulibacter sp.]|nr:hypothetical protein [Accumulibacter sp.]
MNGRSGGFSNLFLASDLNRYSFPIDLAFPVRTLRMVFQSLPFDKLRTGRANGLKNTTSTNFFRQAQDRAR